MKAILFALLLALSAATLFAEPPQIQTTKSSNTTEFNAVAEVKAYYLQLMKSDPCVKQQFEAVAKRSPLWGDVHSSAAEPQVVSWYPRQDEWDVGKGFYRYDQRFLVIQPIEFGRPKWLEYDFAVVSEFRVLHEGKTQIDPKGGERSEFVSNKITIQFLGFRDLNLSPVKESK